MRLTKHSHDRRISHSSEIALTVCLIIALYIVSVSVSFRLCHSTTVDQHFDKRHEAAEQNLLCLTVDQCRTIINELSHSARSH